MGETGHAVANTLDSLVGTTERLCGLPAVATLDWCSRAAQALSVLLVPCRVCVMVAKAEPSGRVVSLEASGCGSTVSKADAITSTASNWAINETDAADDGSGIELGIRSRADRIREFGFRLDTLEPGETISATAARLGGTELWRTAPIGNIWVGSDISDLLVGALRLDAGAPARFLIVEIGLLGHGPMGPRRCSIDNHAALNSVMALLARRAGLALAVTADDEIPWLTVREQQILEQLVLGRSVRSIADELERSPHTVHDHVKSLHRKLGATSRGELIARALGYIEPEAHDTEETTEETADESLQTSTEQATMAEPKLTITSDEETTPPEVVVRTSEMPTRHRDDN
jgi:DNA-binding CsgD family transcriptional regulator